MDLSDGGLDDADGEALGDAARAALQESGWGLRFGPRLRGLYERYRTARQISEQRRIMAIGVLAYVVLSLIIKALVVSEPLWRTTLVQILLLPSIAFLVVQVFYRADRSFATRERAMLSVVCLISVATIGPVGWSPAGTLGLNLSLAILPVIGSLVLLQMPFWTAAVYVTVSLAAELAVLAARPDVPAAIRAYPIAFLLGSTLPALLAAHRLERAARRNFLHDLLRVLENRQLATEKHFLRELSATDALTGAANRRRLDAVLAALCLTPPGRDFLLLIDVDRFKQFNDRYGHLAGDLCLREVVRAASAQLRRDDLLARYGGEEFAVVLTNLNQAEAHDTAERIRAAVAAHRLVVDQERAAVTVSIGITPRSAGDDARRLLLLADTALYAAKNAGRDRVCWPPEFDAAMDRKFVR